MLYFQHTTDTRIVLKSQDKGHAMKRITAIAWITMLLFLALSNLASAYQRTVLVENFTNWG